MLLSHIVAKIVLPRLEITVSQESINNHFKELRNLGSTAVAATFGPKNLSVLSLLSPSSKNPEQKTVIYLPARSSCWQQHLRYLKKLHLDSGVHIYAPNYHGNKADMLVTDIHAFTKWLIQNGIPANKLILFGSDMGAAIATCTAAKLEEEGITVDVISDGGYKSFGAYIRHNVPLCSKMAAKIVQAASWEFDVEGALKKLKGRFYCLASPQDSTVPPWISVKSLVDDARCIVKDENEFMREHPQYAQDPDYNPHTRPFTRREHEALVAAITSCRR